MPAFSLAGPSAFSLAGSSAFSLALTIGRIGPVLGVGSAAPAPRFRALALRTCLISSGHVSHLLIEKFEQLSALTLPSPQATAGGGYRGVADNIIAAGRRPVCAAAGPRRGIHNDRLRLSGLCR